MTRLSPTEPRVRERLGSAGHEIKFTVPPASGLPLRMWTASVCRPDLAHPPARVWTVYFDTPGLALLSEKVNSDERKTKIRVRWYVAADGLASTVFAEVKSRLGSRRAKARVALPVTAGALARWPLYDPRWMDLLTDLRAAAPTLPARVAPVLCISYARHRFVDCDLTARVTIDSDIRASRTSAAMARGAVGLDTGVFEYKSQQPDLPPHLGPIVRFGARRQSFSKYLACYQALTRLTL